MLTEPAGQDDAAVHESFVAESEQSGHFKANQRVHLAELLKRQVVADRHTAEVPLFNPSRRASTGVAPVFRYEVSRSLQESSDNPAVKEI